jgi:demethylmenaquinone methyltransferase / 2-methoxy-6-polyprenyl-1,4-benzoquinol methylase
VNASFPPKRLSGSTNGQRVLAANLYTGWVGGFPFGAYTGTFAFARAGFLGRARYATRAVVTACGETLVLRESARRSWVVVAEHCTRRENDQRMIDGGRSPRKRHALALFEGLPRHYDRMGALLSFGQDPRWRRALVRAVDPQPGERFLDVATGTGMVATALVRRSGCEVVAVDQSEAMLAAARARMAADPRLATRMSFIAGEAEQLPFADAEFDGVTFTYLLRYVDDRAATMRELVRVLKPGGRIGMVEFGVPQAAPFRALWRVQTRVGLPLLGRLVSPAWLEVGRFLGPSIEELHALEPDLVGLWEAAGIRDVRLGRASFGAGVVMCGVRNGDRTA